MSRSYRKGHQYAGDKGLKKIFNRRLRRSNKCQDIPNGNAYKKFNESYEICDYRGPTNWEYFRTWPWVFNPTVGWDPFGYGNFNNEKEAYAYWKKYCASK